MTQPCHISDTYDGAIDAFSSFGLAVAALRECGVRDGTFAPRDDRERAWANAGPVAVHELETGR